MEKLEYIKKSFSRTNKKDYENYILTGIWHRLNNLNLKPVTQQYVKFKDGYALIDMYFPQIDFAIEVDEPYHNHRDHKDIRRMDMIYSAITNDRWTSCSKESAGSLFHRISILKKPNKDTNTPPEIKTLAEINQDIDEIVDKINIRIQEQKDKGENLEWISYEQELAKLKQQSSLSQTEDFSFRYIKDIANTIFGKSYKAAQRGFFKNMDPDPVNKIHLWTPKLAVRKGDTLIAPAQGWFNELSEDWMTIKEKNQMEKINVENMDYEKENGWRRAVFAQYRNSLGINSYRFVGIFSFDKTTTDSDSITAIYTHVDDKVSIVK